MLDENFELQAGEWIPRSFKSLDVTLLIKTPGYFDSAVGEASRIILESTGSTGYIVPPEDRHITVVTLVSGEDTERADTQAITRRLSYKSWGIGCLRLEFDHFELTDSGRFYAVFKDNQRFDELRSICEKVADESAMRKKGIRMTLARFFTSISSSLRDAVISAMPVVDLQILADHAHILRQARFMLKERSEISRIILDPGHFCFGPVNPTILMLGGGSGEGKSTLSKDLAGKDGFFRLQRVYTRPRREGESQGHFLDREEFERMQDLGEIVYPLETRGKLFGVCTSELQQAWERGDIAVGENLWQVIDGVPQRNIKNCVYLLIASKDHKSKEDYGMAVASRLSGRDRIEERIAEGYETYYRNRDQADIVVFNEEGRYTSTLMGLSEIADTIRRNRYIPCIRELSEKLGLTHVREMASASMEMENDTGAYMAYMIIKRRLPDIAAALEAEFTEKLIAGSLRGGDLRGLVQRELGKNLKHSMPPLRQRNLEFHLSDKRWPLQLEVDLSESCNLRCRYCLLTKGKGKALFMETHKVLRILDELSGYKGLIRLSGETGEPLLHPDAGKIMSAITERRLAFCLITNGTLLARHVLQAREAEYVNVSLDAADRDDFRMLKGADLFEQVMEGIRLLGKEKKRLAVSFVLQPDTYHKIIDPTFLSTLSSMGVDEIYLKFQHEHQEWLADDEKKILAVKQMLLSRGMESEAAKVHVRAREGGMMTSRRCLISQPQLRMLDTGHISLNACCHSHPEVHKIGDFRVLVNATEGHDVKIRECEGLTIVEVPAHMWGRPIGRSSLPSHSSIDEIAKAIDKAICKNKAVFQGLGSISIYEGSLLEAYRKAKAFREVDCRKVCGKCPPPAYMDNIVGDMLDKTSSIFMSEDGKDAAKKTVLEAMRWTG